MWPQDTTLPPTIPLPVDPTLTAFDFASLPVELQNWMIQIWPDWENGLNLQFWKDEWEKHGKCAGLSQIAYIEKCKEIWEHVRIDILFVSANVIRQPNAILLSVLKSQLAVEMGGVQPLIACKETMKRQVLSEVRFCLNSTNHFVSCGPLRTDANCEAHKLDIVYD
ncbi:ribonuclease T2 [Trifolium repens]|nr:ribonuclease T2 [Trifolium repens]